MDAACIRQTHIPHGTRLFEDFTYDFSRVRRFYAHDPHDPQSFPRAAAALDPADPHGYPDARRAALVRALRKQNGDCASLDLLAQPGTVAVVTGQQVGLFTGPAYTIYKALTAVKRAERLREQGTPAVPVFWLATEDHDFAEVDHAWVFDGRHRPELLRATGDDVDRRPVGRVALEQAPIDDLRQVIEPFPFAAEVMAAIEAAYPRGVTMGAGFHALLRRFLDRFGLVYIDPLDPEIRKIGAPLLRDAVLAGDDLRGRLIARNRELESAGYHAQVHIEEQTSLVFLLDHGRRSTLRAQDGGYRTREARYSPSELADRAADLSPNALLRPVFEDYLLPTAVYVGGPAEVAYIAQAAVLYRELLGRMPVVEHRAGFTLLDHRAKKLMTRYELAWTAIYEGEPGIRQAISERLIPQSLTTAFADAACRTGEALDAIHRELSSFDPTLVAALDSSRRKVMYQLTKLERKIERESIRRDQRASEEARFLAGLLYPNKHLQERLYSIVPFLAKHGFGLIDRIYESVALDCPDHRVLVI
jgi:bacillithiol synthase